MERLEPVNVSNLVKVRLLGAGRGGARRHVVTLNIQVLHIQRIVFDELAPRFHIFAH